MDLVEHADQRRAEKSAGLLLADDNVTRLRCNLLDNFVALVPRFGHVFARAAVFCLPASKGDCVGPIIVPGRVKVGRCFFLASMRSSRIRWTPSHPSAPQLLRNRFTDSKIGSDLSPTKL